MRYIYYIIITYRFTMIQARILKVLYDSAPNFVPAAEIANQVYEGQFRCETIVAKSIHTIRDKLRKHNIVVQNQYGKGYAMTAPSATHLKQLFREGDDARL